MANATQTIAGDVQLAGDLAGNNNAASPALTNTAVTPGSYSLASITVDSKGRLTAASNGSITLAGDVTGPTSATVLSNTAVTPGSYTNSNITVDAKGRITSASNGASSLSGDVTGPFSATVLSNTAVTPGTYNYATITVDAKGRITAASTNAAPTAPTASYVAKGTVQITADTGLTISSGNLSGTLATNTVYGVVKSADVNNITITAGAIDVGPNIPKLNTVNTFTKAIRTTPSALTSSTSIALDASLSNVYTLTIGHNATLNNPTNLGAGRYTFIIKQDATGSRTLTYGSSFIFPTGHDKVLSTAANSVNVVTCVSNGTYLYCTLAKNFV